MKRNFDTPSGAIRITPQEQLWKETPKEMHDMLATILGQLKYEAQEDLCHALVAYARFGIERTFYNTFMEAVYGYCVRIIDNNNNNSLNINNYATT